MKIGYIRVSSKDQNLDRQIEHLKNCGVEKIYQDKTSGKNTDRSGLKEMMEFIREGDIVYIVSISRLARNTLDFLNIMKDLEEKKVCLVCLKEPIDTTTPAGRMMATVFASMYQMERENIKQRQSEGISAAKAKGIKFGRPRQELTEDFKNIYDRWKAKEITGVKAMNLLGMKKNTFYRRVNEYENRNN